MGLPELVRKVCAGWRSAWRVNIGVINVIYPSKFRHSYLPTTAHTGKFEISLFSLTLHSPNGSVLVE